MGRTVMRFAVIENGKVTNVVTAATAREPNWLPSETAAIGDLYDGVKFIRPARVIPVPEEVTMVQARKALIKSGIKPSVVDTAIAAIPDEETRELAQADWQYATAISRNSDLVAALAPALGLNDDKIDALFILAGTL